METDKKVYVDDLQGEYFIVRFAYDLEIVSRLKCIGGAYWSPEHKGWLLPATSLKLKQLLQLLVDYQIVQKSKLSLQRYQEEDSNFIEENITLLQSFLRELCISGYSSQTVKTYRHHVERFFRYINSAERTMDPSELIRNYLLDLVEKGKVSRAYHSQTPKRTHPSHCLE